MILLKLRIVLATIDGGKARIVSQTGKIVLLKSNLSGTPLYTVSGIKIPNNILMSYLMLTENSFGVKTLFEKMITTQHA